MVRAIPFLSSLALLAIGCVSATPSSSPGSSGSNSGGSSGSTSGGNSGSNSVSTSGGTTGAAAPTPYACSGNPTPASDLASIGGSVSVTGTCFFTGDLLLSGTGTTSILSDGATFNLAGNLGLSGSTSFKVVGGVFRLASQFVFQYSIAASDSATFEMQDAELSTNDGTVGGTTTSNYAGSGSSVLMFSNVTIDEQHSWLLASANDQASILVSNSKAPVEIYPADAATISVSGPSSTPAIWLDFVSGLSASITGLPDNANPYTFSLGARTAATSTVSTNVGFQVDVTNASPGFGFVSHPGSSIALTSPQGTTAYDYYFDDPAAPIDITGSFVVSHGTPLSTTFSDSSRTLQLVDVPLSPIAWQVYTDRSSGTAQPVTITGSTSDPTQFVTINEAGAFNGGSFVFDTVTLLWATITAFGSGSISITNSQIASQTIEVMDTARVSIMDSTIYGSLFQVRANGVITLVNTPLLQVEAAPNPPPAGFPALALNPTMPDPTAFPIFVTDPAGGAVVDATIAPVGTAALGSTIVFRGDAFAESQVTPACTFDLSYQAAGESTFTPVTTGGACPKLARNAGDSLGSLDTTGLQAGSYTAKLEVFLGGTPTLVAPMSFTLQ